MAGQGSFSWRGVISNGCNNGKPGYGNNGVPFLSPVRTNRNNTCFYRSLCDALDARARIATRTYSVPFRARFSVNKMIELEENWLTDPSKKVQHCLQYFKHTSNPLPTYPEGSPVNFRILDYEVLNITPENAQRVRDEVSENGPVVGRHQICEDYLKPGVYRANDSDNGEYNPPEAIADPMSETPPIEGIVRPKKKKPSEEGEPSSVIPPQRDPLVTRISHHAVCIVGYRNENGEECFEVQENQGRNFCDGGFRLVTQEAMLKAYMVTIGVIPN